MKQNGGNWYVTAKFPQPISYDRSQLEGYPYTSTISCGQNSRLKQKDAQQTLATARKCLSTISASIFKEIRKNAALTGLQTIRKQFSEGIRLPHSISTKTLFD